MNTFSRYWSGKTGRFTFGETILHIRFLLVGVYSVPAFFFALYLVSGQSPPKVIGTQTPSAASPKTTREDTLSIDALNDRAERCAIAASDFALDTALADAQAALETANKIGYKRGIVKALGIISLSLSIQDKLTQALSFGLQELSLADEIGDTLAAAKARAHIGFASGMQGRSDRTENESARAYLFKAIPVWQAAKDTFHLALCYNSLGRIFRKERDFDRGLEYHQQGLQYARSIGNFFHIGWAEYSIAAIYESRGNISEALPYAHDALQTREKGQIRYGTAVSLWFLGNLYLRLNKLGKALYYAHRGITVSESAPNVLLDTKYRCCRLLSEIYAAQNDFRSALQYYKIYVATLDSLSSLEAQNNIYNLQARLEIERKERENTVLLKDRVEQTSQLERQRIIVLASSIVLVLLALLVIILFRSNRWRKQQHQTMSEAFDEIQRQKEALQKQAQSIELANSELSETNVVLELKNEELMRLNNEKNEFLGIAAHDLKTPLAGILLGIGVLKMGYGRLTQEAFNQKIESIANTVRRMLDIITGLLDINAMETGKMQFTFAEFDVQLLVQDVVRDCTEAAAEKNIALRLVMPESGPLVYADRAKTFAIVENLLSNAIKYSPSGTSVQITVKNRQTLDKSGSPTNSGCLILVKDEGPGLSEEDLRNLFGKFTRLSAQPTAGEHSSGLGLSIVKKFTEAMHGSVRCESEPGKGATFIVELPS